MPRIALRQNMEDVPSALLDPLLELRGGKLLKIDRLLLLSPPYAAGWNALLRAVLNDLTIEPRLGQLAMSAIAVLNGANYELFAHGAAFLATGGTKDQLERIKEDVRAASQDETVFNELERAILSLTVEMTCDVEVTDETFTRMKKMLKDDRIVADYVGTIATYNMVTRYVVALKLDVDETGL